MTEYDGSVFDEEMIAQQLAEERRAVEILRGLGYKHPESTLFALRVMEALGERSI